MCPNCKSVMDIPVVSQTNRKKPIVPNVVWFVLVGIILVPILLFSKTPEKVSLFDKGVLIFLVVLITTIFGYSLYALFVQGRILLLPNLLQPVLFCILYIHIYSLDPQHYYCNFSPAWYNWIQFTMAHILRAADILDLIDTVDAHNIRVL